MRNVQEYTRAPPWYILEVTCTNNMFAAFLYNSLCTSNMFMVSQVAVLWLYMSYTFCVVIYWVSIYLSTKIYFIGGWGGLTCISKTPVVLPTFLFNGNYVSPSLAFRHPHLS